MSKRLYKRGMKLKSMRSLEREILRGNYVFIHNKPTHPGWLRSMQWNLLKNYIDRGSIYKALKNKGYKKCLQPKKLKKQTKNPRRSSDRMFWTKLKEDLVQVQPLLLSRSPTSL